MITKLPQINVPTPKPVTINYDNWRGGVNFLLRQNEIKPNELAQAENLLLIGLGVPTKRWGTIDNFLAGETGYGRGLIEAKQTTGSTEVLAITDSGILTRKSNASYVPLTGASWPSGYNLEGTQLDNRVYLVNEQTPFIRYDFSSLIPFEALSTPTSMTATNISGATGTTTWSWRVSAVSRVGETLASTAISLASLPQNLSDTMIRISWAPVSAASGVLSSYNVYRGFPGDETWLAGVDNITTSYDDFGITASQLTLPPSADTTAGIKAKYIIRYQDRLILAGINGDPTRVYISGRVPFHERFDASSGGGYVDVDPDTNEIITGLAIWRGKIIVFKENSIWELSLSTVSIGNYLLLNPQYQLITLSQGCSSHRSITYVYDDVYFCNSRGMFVLGQAPNIGVEFLRANELSAKIRPFFQSLTPDDFANATGEYFDYKWVVHFPNSKKTIIFDRERGAFMGPWTTPFGFNRLKRITDENGVERLLGVDSTDAYVSEFSKTATDDKGTAFQTLLKMKKEDYGSWNTLKTINNFLFNFRNVFGTVNVNVYLEGRDGSTLAQKSFEITSQQSQSGIGVDQWGTPEWGLTNENAQASSEDLIKNALLFKTGRTSQIEIITNNKADNYELLHVKLDSVIPLSLGQQNYTWNV